MSNLLFFACIANMFDITYSPYLNLNRFDLQLKDFGVDTTTLQAVKNIQFFRALVEDWEGEVLYDNNVVAETQLLTKFKGLVFHDPDTEKTFSVFDGNLEF